tara:strand:+ start:1760 stop:1963 length:204 start_codon:yes stop_codon:yes gene_type:complete
MAAPSFEIHNGDMSAAPQLQACAPKLLHPFHLGNVYFHEQKIQKKQLIAFSIFVKKHYKELSFGLTD